MVKSKAKTLSQFSITGKGEGFTLHIEDAAGETLEFDTTRDQLDVIVESLEVILSEDDA